MTPLSTRPSIGGDILQIRRRGGSAKPGYVDAVLTDHPLALWPLDDPVGSLEARDLSGHVNPGDVAQGHQTLIFGVPGYTADGATALQQTTVSSGSPPPSVENTSVLAGLGNVAFTLEIAASSVDTAETPILIAVSGFTVPLTIGRVYVDATQLHLNFGALRAAWDHHVTPDNPTWHLYGASSDGAGGFSGYCDGADLGAPIISGSGVPNFVSPGFAVLGVVGLNGDDGPATVAMAALYDHVVPAARMLAHAMAR